MMNQDTTTLPRAFWIVAGGGLVWTLIGVATFVMTVTVTPAALAELSEAERQLLQALPSFVLYAYAIAVIAGVLGCVALLLRRRWATYVFALSLVSILIQMSHTLFVSNHLNVYGPAGAILPVTVVLVAAFLVWFSGVANKKGWLS